MFFALMLVCVSAFRRAGNEAFVPGFSAEECATKGGPDTEPRLVSPLKIREIFGFNDNISGIRVLVWIFEIRWCRPKFLTISWALNLVFVC